MPRLENKVNERHTIFRQSQLFEVCVGIDACFSGRLLSSLNNSITHGPSPNVYWCDTSNATYTFSGRLLTGFLQSYYVGSSLFRRKLRQELALEPR